MGQLETPREAQPSPEERDAGEAGGRQAPPDAATQPIPTVSQLASNFNQLISWERVLFESVIEGIFVIDSASMKVLLCNRAAASMYGLDSAEEALGASCLDFVHPDDRQRALKVIAEDMFRQNLHQPNEFRTITRGGEEKWVSAIGTTIEFRGELLGLVSFRDITERKRAQRRLEVIAELTAIIGSSLDIDDVYETFAQGVKQLVDFDQASITLVEEGNLRFLAVSSSVDTELIADSTIPLAGTPTEWVVTGQRTNIEQDFAVQMQFPIDEIHFREGLRSAIRLPLLSRGEALGSFNLTSRRPKAYGEEQRQSLEELAGQMAVAIQNHKLFAEVRRRRDELEVAYQHLAQSAQAMARREQELEEAYMNMARIMVCAQEERDPYTGGHSGRVADACQHIAAAMGMPPADISQLRSAALLHDLGRAGISKRVLDKPGSLTEGEQAEVKLGLMKAVELLRHCGTLDGALAVIESHHEHYDGSGYPHQSTGDEIPLGARILAVADAYDAMTSPRPYRPAMSAEEALEVLKQEAGKQWDPRVVETLLQVMYNKPHNGEHAR